jgi:hypothetical protein
MPASAACPACGIYFFKYAQDAAATGLRDGLSADSLAEDEPGFFGSLLQPMDKMDSATFYGRCAALASLAVWSVYLFGYDYRSGEIGSSFMHDILLPIHEAGHVLFRPFGTFMMILGGSLFQVALPLGIGIAFILKNRDNFGASLGFWWASVSLVDLSPYIYDALHPQLILLGGHTGEDGPHDWIYLLLRLGQLANAQRWGALVHACGGALMLLALLWGAFILVQQHRQADENGGAVS